MKSLGFIFFIIACTLSNNVLASSNSTPPILKQTVETKDAAQTTQGNETTNVENSVNLREPTEFQKVVDEYKEYVAKIPAKTRDEVIAYRKELAKLYKEKRLLFKQLSQEAQDYLKEEQKFKKRLPFDRKKLINMDAQEEKTEDTKKGK